MENERRRRCLSQGQAAADRGPAGETHAHVQRRHSRATSIDDLTDDLLDLVLLRVHSPVCLVRAAATCRLWRRVIAGAGFLRRFWPLHSPLVLGYYLNSEIPGGEIVSACRRCSFSMMDDAPPWTPAPTSACQRCSFSLNLDFLPHPAEDHHRQLADSRGGLLVFAGVHTSIVVCNPCTRQHEEVRPPLTEDGFSSSEYVGTFLLDADDADGEAATSPLMSRFRVLYLRIAYDHGRGRSAAQAHVFSARDRRWRLLSTTEANNVIFPAMALHCHRACTRSPADAAHMDLLGRTGDCVFWGILLGNNDVLTLDECTGEFSVLVLPEPEGSNRHGQGMQYDRGNLRAISGNARTVRLVRLVGNDLEVLTIGRDSGACVVDGRVGLSQLAKIEATRSLKWNFLDTAPEAGPGCVVLSPDWKNLWMFTIETMELERLSERISGVRVFPYELPWPPSIKACLQDYTQDMMSTMTWSTTRSQR